MNTTASSKRITSGALVLQALGGIVIGLIALLSSFDHISYPAGAVLPFEQQWGVWCIVASVALVVADAQLGSRHRERNREDQEQNRAAVDEVGRRPKKENAQLAELNAKPEM